MSRFSILWPPMLSLAACASGDPVGDNTVDINAAAMQAQDAVDAYGARAEGGDKVEVAKPEALKAMAEPRSNVLAPLVSPTPGTPGNLPDEGTPVPEAPFTPESAPESAQDAATVVRTYYALIGERNYAQAFALREPGAFGAETAAAFAADFARYGDYRATVGAPGAIDAGAGQRFVTVPVQVVAHLKDGGALVSQRGSVVLHRTGDVDGATAAQRAWHIRSIDLKSTPDR